MVWLYKKELNASVRRCEKIDHLEELDAPVRRCEKIDHLDNRRSRGRSNKNWSKVIRYDLKTLELVEDKAQDRGLWKSRIKVTDFR